VCVLIETLGLCITPGDVNVIPCRGLRTCLGEKAHKL
jgi:hypothetical protein